MHNDIEAIPWIEMGGQGARASAGRRHDVARVRLRGVRSIPTASSAPFTASSAPTAAGALSTAAPAPSAPAAIAGPAAGPEPGAT